MSEINFIDQEEKKKPKNGEGSSNGKIEWSEPGENKSGADTGKAAGWFSFLSKNSEAKNASNLSRQDALRMIKEYVEVKEKAGKPGKAAAEPPPEKEKEPPEAAVEQAVFKQKIDRPPASEPRSAAVPAPEEKSWFKKIFKRRKNEETPDHGILATDLIKGEIVVVFDWGKNLSYLLFFILVSSLLIAAAYQGIAFWENSKLKQVNSDFSKFGELKSQIKENEKGVETVLVLQKKLDAVKSLLDNHIYWTEFFNFLEENTLTDIFFGGFAGDTGGSYKLGGTASDFRTIAEQLRVLKENKLVNRAVISGGETKSDSAQSADTRVSFELDLQVDKNIFFKKK